MESCMNLEGDAVMFVDVQKTDKAWGSELLLKRTEQYVMKVLNINSGRNTSYHYHKKSSETWYVVAGTGYIMIDGGRVGARPGLVVHIAPGKSHQIMALTDMEVVVTSCAYLDDTFVLENKNVCRGVSV